MEISNLFDEMIFYFILDLLEKSNLIKWNPENNIKIHL